MILIVRESGDVKNHQIQEILKVSSRLINSFSLLPASSGGPRYRSQLTQLLEVMESCKNTDEILTLTHYCFSLPPVDPNAPRKRRSRWGEAKTEIPGLPTAISAAGVSQVQLDNYAIHLRLEEINRKLRLNDFIPPERERYLAAHTFILCVYTDMALHQVTIPSTNL